jgi:2-polyprenyl-6-methoxyphenol hydroxylase-like FAD-dependent oxidoreductase
LAYWLERAGHEVLLVEAAPALRTGGLMRIPLVAEIFARCFNSSNPA